MISSGRPFVKHLGDFGECFGENREGLLHVQGVRTRSEIDREIYALKVARGDFKHLPADRREDAPVPVRQIMQAVNA